MATFTKLPLSGSTTGKGIKLTGTATGSSVTLHQAGSGTTNMDEVWIYAFNNDTSNVTLTLEWGGTAVPDDNIVAAIPYQQGLTLVVPGLLMQNSLYIKAFASIANKIVIFGFVNRITA